MNGNARDVDVGGRHAEMLQVERALVGGAEVSIGRLIDPQAVRVEIGADRDLRQRSACRLRSFEINSAGKKCVLMTRFHCSSCKKRSKASRFSFCTACRSLSRLRRRISPSPSSQS